jgi:hypothetical protein
MMAMANDQSATWWRNFAAWSAVGAVSYSLVVLSGTSFLHDEGVVGMLRDLLRSQHLAALLGLGLVLSTALVGFTSLRRPFSLRALRNFALRDAIGIVGCLIVVWGFSALAGAGALQAMGPSAWVAAAVGATLVIVAILGGVAVAGAHTGGDFIDDELAADDLRERGRLIVYGLGWMGVCGLLLIGLSLAGPGGVLSPTVALAGALVLIVTLVVLGLAAWRLSDELGRTLSYETGNLAFYLILAVGGGWATLAQLGLVDSPAPLDWLTLFIVLLYVASFIAAGRRKLLTR